MQKYRYNKKGNNAESTSTNKEIMQSLQERSKNNNIIVQLSKHNKQQTMIYIISRNYNTIASTTINLIHTDSRQSKQHS